MKKWIATISLLCVLLCGCSMEIVFIPEETVSPPQLTVHYLDVGQADCTLLECDGEFMLIDGGNRDDGRLVVSYLRSCGVEQLQAVVCTHAHEDHVGGLPSVLAVFPTEQVYAPTDTYASKVFDDFLHYVDQQRLAITIPAPGDSFSLGGADVTVLGPVKSYAELNNTSLVLLVTFGENRFLFTGDAEREAENDMLDYWEGKMDWDVDILKAGHHGSSTSSGYRFVYETNPEYVVVSCGKDNDYGHPHREIIDLYKAAGVPLFRTDQLGTVLAVSGGQEITITWEKQHAAPKDLEPVKNFGKYIGNKNSRMLHAPFCDSLPKKKNQIIFDSFDEAIEAGYKVCSGCLG